MFDQLRHDLTTSEPDYPGWTPYWIMVALAQGVFAFACAMGFLFFVSLVFRGFGGY